MKTKFLCLAAVFAAFTVAAIAQQPKPVRALLITGGCCHDYGKQKDVLKAGIEERAHVVVDLMHSSDTSTKPPLPIYGNADYAKGYDVVIHDECSADVKDMETVKAVLKPHLDGVAAVNLHCAMHSYRTEGWNQKGSQWMSLTGLITTGHGPQKPIEITFTDANHPITKGLEGWTTGNEELYNNILIDKNGDGKADEHMDGIRELARGKQGNENNLIVWVNEYGPKKTRVFSTTLGHNTSTVADPRYLDLVTRGLLWSVNKLDSKHLKAPPAVKKN